VFRLYDTQTRQVEAIAPRGGLLRMYSCGPAVDRRAHVGDLRTYLLDDLIRRNAERRHHLMVLSAQGIADAGYVTGGSARGEAGGAAGGGPAELARNNEEAFRADCSALNLLPAEQSPLASESIALITDMIAGLIDSGHAYPTPDGSVHFAVRSFPGYGELSGREPGSEPGGDWVLWHVAPDGRWPSPWGSGFPDRSTECSALALHHLGEVIDIHTGDIDLCFPHHENERAQLNSLTGRAVVRHWVHAERLLFDGRPMATPAEVAASTTTPAEKTASAGNVVFLADLADRGLDPLALRLAFLEHRHRQQLNLTWDALDAADRELRRWRGLVAEWACSPSKPMCAEVTAEIATAFDDDLDTLAALRTLRTLEEDPEIPPGSKFETFAHADQLLGLDLVRDIGRAPAQPA
jgi:cysteinyl-tRNA synthetase